MNPSRMEGGSPVSSLSNLYIARRRLQEARSPGEVLAVVQEVIAAMVGSEEVAVFERVAEPPGVALLPCCARTSLTVNTESIMKYS